MFKELVIKYIEKVLDFTKSTNIIQEDDGIILDKTQSADFKFKQILFAEVKEYCKNKNIHKVDKIILISISDVDILSKDTYTNFNVKSKSESRIIITEENDKTIAQVFIGDYIKIKGK